MNKSLILMLISLNASAGDFLDFLNLMESKPLSIEESEGILKSLASDPPNLKRKKNKAPPSDKRDKKVKFQREAELLYYDLEGLEQSLVDQALNNLDILPGKTSYIKSFIMYGEEAREDAYRAIELFGLGNFNPLFKAIIEVIKEKEAAKGREIMHMALRVDPDASLMKLNRERRFTSDWHNHQGILHDEGNDDRYLFALTRNEKLATMIKNNGVEKYIDSNRIFLLPGAMVHRTPDPSPGKRIQLSISVFNKD